MELQEKKTELGPIADLVREADAHLRVARSDTCPPFAFESNAARAEALLEAAAKALRTLRGLR